MITEEQIKNIRQGDTIYLNNYPLTFQTSNIHGHVFAHDNVAECGEGCACWFSNKYLSLTSAENTPKYDPCRKFRKGDEVRVQQFRGRCGSSLIPSGNTAIVIDSEDEDCLVVLENPSRFGKPTIVIHSCFLELVTPVEERFSFRVGDFPVDGEWSVWKNSFGKTEIISSYKIATHPNAKEAAEAECDRLNAEYRKEQA